MAERPIIFSAESVRAILAGTKTQTRRAVNFSRAKCASDCAGPIPDKAWIDKGGTIFGPGPYLKIPCADDAAQRVFCPYGYPEDGAQLWVRETWHQCPKKDKERYCYKADGCCLGADEWTSPLYMPRWASRLSLRITSIRAERVQSITESDAIAEGVEPVAIQVTHGGKVCGGGGLFAREMFAAAWDSINGKRAPWSSNPWVWVVSFERAAQPERAS